MYIIWIYILIDEIKEEEEKKRKEEEEERRWQEERQRKEEERKKREQEAWEREQRELYKLQQSVSVYCIHVQQTVDVKNIYKIILRRVWRYQRGNQNLYVEEEQTTQWPKEKGQTKSWATPLHKW